MASDWNNPRGGAKPPLIHVPDHELLSLIGEGSYGQVWLARNTIGTYRAVKIIRKSSFKHERPFEREIEGIRQFEPISRTHPGLVAVLHVGRSTDGDCFYYVMELGDDINRGTEIDPETYQVKTLASAVWDRGALHPDRCIDIGLSLSNALAHLHSKDLIHRDVKPANIIFVAGYPKLADIGLVAEANTASTYVGTEGFIPPEGPNSPQGDVFSLGKTLYEISTGQDRNQFPAIPASSLGEASGSTFVELIEIINQACHPDRSVRYDSARSMHAEITALANGRSIRRLRLLERRMTAISRASKIAAMVLIPVLMIAFTLHQNWQNRLQEIHREIGMFEGMAASEMSNGDFSKSLQHVGHALELAPDDQANSSLQRLRAGAVLDLTPSLTHFWIHDSSINCLKFSQESEFVFAAGDNGHVARYSLSDDSVLFYKGHIGDVRAIDIHEPSGRLMSVGEDQTVRVWDIGSARNTHAFEYTLSLWAAAFSPDGNIAAAAGGHGELESVVSLWNLEDGSQEKPVLNIPVDQRVWDLEFSKSGERILAAVRNTVFVFNTEDGAPIGEPLVHPKSVYDLTYIDDDTAVATACDDGHYRIWDLESGNLVYLSQRQDFAIRGIDESPDGRSFVTAGWDRVVRFWDRPDGTELFPMLRHSGRVNEVEYANDGHRLVTGCSDGSLRVWDLAGVQVPNQFAGEWQGHRNRFLARKTDDKVEIKRSALKRQVGGLLDAGRILFTASGDHILVVDSDENPPAKIQLVDPNQPEAPTDLIELPLEFELRIAEHAISAGRLIVAGRNAFQQFDLATRQPVWPAVEFEEEIDRMFLSHSEELIFVLTAKAVHVFGTANQDKKFGPFRSKNKLRFACLSPDDRILAVCESDAGLGGRSAYLYEVERSTVPYAELNHGDGVLMAAFRPDGLELVTVSEDGTAVMWETETGEFTGRVLEHRHSVGDVAYSSDGRFLITGCADRTVRLWDSESGFPVTPSLRLPWFVSLSTYDVKDGLIMCQSTYSKWTWTWKIPKIEYPGELLLSYAGALSGDRLTDARGVREINSGWERLKEAFPSAVVVPKSRIIAWHRSRAFDALMEIARLPGQFVWEDYERLEDAEAFHVGQLAQLEAKDMDEYLDYSFRVRRNVRQQRGAADEQATDEVRDGQRE